MNKLRFLLLLIFFTNLTYADFAKGAYVNRPSIDLYSKPDQKFKIASNKFFKNDLIPIYECNDFGWCKTDEGYVKKHLLIFTNEIKDEEKEIKKIQDDYSTEKFASEIDDLIKNKKNNSISRWKTDQIFQRTSVDEDIKDILTSIALQNGSQIILGKGIEGTETLSIEKMPLEGAFNLILERNNLDYKWEGNTLIVNSISQTETKKEFITLKQLDIPKLITLMKRYNIYDSMKNRITFDNEMNSLYIEADNASILELKTLISRFEDAEKVLQESKIERTKKSIELQQLSQIKGQNDNFSDKKKKYGLNEYDDWKMKIEVVQLKYISVGSTQMDFQGKKIKVESLEDTLKGLLGTGYVEKNNNTLNDDKVDVTNNTNNRVENAYLKIDQRTNSIIIKDYPDKIDEIKNIISQIDRPSKLLEIEVTVATGTTGLTKKLGMQLGGIKTNGNVTYGVATSEAVATTLNDPTNSSLLQPTNSLGLTSSMLFTGNRSLLNFQLNAMEEDGGGKVISNPKIVTLDNREATILSGKTLSIPVTTDNSIGLEEVNTGISIRTTPHIIEKKGEKESDKFIMLDIKIERSELGIVTETKIEKATNEINSSVIMKNGETLILGGLFNYDKTDSRTGVPLLKDIPLLGLLFSTDSKTLNKSELLFFITPKIITNDLIKEQNDSRYMDYQKTLKKEKVKF